MRPFRLHGLVAAPFTPLCPDGSLHLELIPRLVERLLADQVGGAFVLGTTGEGLSLTDSERESVAEAWVNAAAGRLPIVVHVGHLAAPAAARLAAHAQSIRADAIATCGPFFYPIRHVAQIARYCAEVAAAAPRLPFYYYHIPQLTHVTASMEDFLHEAAAGIPTLRGIKYTHNDLEEFGRLVATSGARFDLAFGRDEILLHGLAAGASAAIGSTFNFAAPLFARVVAAVEAGDLRTARRHQADGTRLVQILRRHGGLSAMKAAMAYTGLDCGPTRTPLRSLTPAQTAALHEELAASGLIAAPANAR